MKGFIGFLVALPERCMLCVLLAGGIVGSLIGSQLGDGMRTMPGRLLIVQGFVAGAVAPVALFAVAAIFLSSRNLAEETRRYQRAERFSPGQENVAIVTTVIGPATPEGLSEGILVELKRTGWKGMLDDSRGRTPEKMFVYQAAGEPAKVLIRVTWGSPSVLRIAGSTPPGWHVHQDDDVWRDISIEYDGDLRKKA